MANAEQLALLKAGVEGWNKWRAENPDIHIDLSRANLAAADLVEANLSDADLTEINLSDADLRSASLARTNLHDADLSRAVLQYADFTGSELWKAKLSGTLLSGGKLNQAELIGADLDGANLTSCDLMNANLMGANLTRANLTHADLEWATLVLTNVDEAKISGCHIYAINVWDLEGEFEEQEDLVITMAGEPVITVDNVKVAQFIHLILKNQEIRNVINTLTSKSVLILGRFTIPERKAILDALRNKLREYDLLPIVFDFDRPTDKDFTETIKTLAGLSYFVIADVTNPKSSPLELQATIPDYQIPFVPIIQEGEYPFAMMVDLQKKYNWVLDTISYDSLDTLIEILKPYIIDPAIKKRDELRLIKAKEPTIISGRELKEKEKRDKI